MSDYILEMNHITKIFPGVRALNDVHFNLREGEIHGLMGENGAGKSTFIKTITGVHPPNEGEIILYGQRVAFSNPLEAQRSGIAAIYQHVTCYPDLTVSENIFIGHEKIFSLTKKIDWKEMHAQAQELLDQLDANFSSKMRMGDLSIARQQIVEIAKALSMKAKIIIMDEPTAALSQHESGELYRITEQLRAEGTSIIFISHRFEDLYRLADRVTILRDASYIGTWDLKELDQQKIVSYMVGRPLNQMFPKRKVKIGEEILRVENLSRTGYFRDASFSLHKSEILAITGLVGAGRTEVCESLFGLYPADSGSIFIKGEKAVISSPLDAVAYGIGLLPEDRQIQGLVLEWEIGKNITLPVLEFFTKRGLLNQQEENQLANKLAKKLAVKAPNIFTKASALSGGNQQKVVFAKLISRDLKIIILDEPTKGVDIGAKAAIYEIISDLAEQGYGVIMVSSEMPEVLGLSDKILVMKEGHISAEFETKGTTQEDILHAAMVVDIREPMEAEQ